MMSEHEIRDRIADILIAFAKKHEWDAGLWSTYEELKRTARIDKLQADADEALIHYSGVFESYNLLGKKLSPSATKLEEHRGRLLAIANALKQS